ncbi:tetraspanin-7-like [Bolinopsis microptera]|uniref:tetraspanin-7-like n=1 Tax=Bolinopsis microptera TaxID=2820187 RepID=UPI00307AF82B
MWVILLLEIALSIWIFYSIEPIKQSVRPALFELMRTYEETQGNMQFDKIQYNYECCGVDNHLDWVNTTWGQEHVGLLPGSCCHTMLQTCDISTTNFAQTGCYEYVMNYVDFTYSVDMTILLFSGFAQVVGISLSYTLTRLIREYEVAKDDK